MEEPEPEHKEMKSKDGAEPKVTAAPVALQARGPPCSMQHASRSLSPPLQIAYPYEGRSTGVACHHPETYPVKAGRLALGNAEGILEYFSQGRLKERGAMTLGMYGYFFQVEHRANNKTWKELRKM